MKELPGISRVESISILSGTFTTVGSAGNASIGSGYAYANAFSRVGNITIHNGNVRATGHSGETSYSPGIVSGWGNSGSSSVENILIYSWTISATASVIGAGIGSGYALNSGAISRVGNIYIYNGNVSALGNRGAGIGGWCGESSGAASAGNIYIYNGSIAANGSYDCAGIGSGYGGGGGSSTAQHIYIYNGNVNATATYRAEIGSGFAYNSATSSVGTIYIYNGNINATSTYGGAGIGSGYGEGGTASVGSIYICHGNVNAIGAGNSPGIGSGYSTSSGTSRVGSIYIYDGILRAQGSGGPGIGRGDGATSSLNTISISGGLITILNGSVGISAVSMSSGPSLTITSPHIDCRSMGSKMCLRASSAIFNGGSLTAVTSASNLINFNTVSFSGSPSLYVIYAASSSKEKLTGLAMIHLASVTFPCNSSYEVTVTCDDFKRTVSFNPWDGRGFGISVPFLGNFSISYNSKCHSSEGILVHDGLDTFAALANNDNVYTKVKTDEVTDCQVRPTDFFRESVSRSSPNAIFQSAAFLLWLF
jgi:hypothetical protein